MEWLKAIVGYSVRQIMFDMNGKKECIVTRN